MKKYLLLISIFISCLGHSQDSYRKLTRNGEKSLKSGDFVTASLKGSQALFQKSNFKRAITLYESAIKVVYTTNESKINRLTAEAVPYKDFNSVTKVHQIIALYKKLQEVREASSLIGKVNFKRIKNPLDYGRDYTADIQNTEQLLQEYNMLAAAEFYVKGSNQYAQAQTKEQFLAASNDFKRAEDFVMNYKDASILGLETLNIFNDMSAAQLYNEGLQLYNNAWSKKDFQNAYYVLIQIENFVPNYKDTHELIKICVDRGTYRVAFMPISNGQRFAPILRELNNNSKAHVSSLGFVEVVDINVPGVSNVEVLARYLRSRPIGSNIDHLYKFTVDDFNVIFQDRRVMVTQEKTRNVKRNKEKITISGIFSKIKVSSRAISNAYLEVIDFNNLNTVALVNLSDNILESQNYWIFKEGDIDAFSRWKHLVPLVNDENRVFSDVNNKAANSIRESMNSKIRQRQLQLYN